MFENITVSREI